MHYTTAQIVSAVSLVYLYCFILHSWRSTSFELVAGILAMLVFFAIMSALEGHSSAKVMAVYWTILYRVAKVSQALGAAFLGSYAVVHFSGNSSEGENLEMLLNHYKRTLNMSAIYVIAFAAFSSAAFIAAGCIFRRCASCRFLLCCSIPGSILGLCLLASSIM